jgi:hypothetical protein
MSLSKKHCFYTVLPEYKSAVQVKDDGCLENLLKIETVNRERRVIAVKGIKIYPLVGKTVLIPRRLADLTYVPQDITFLIAGCRKTVEESLTFSIGISFCDPEDTFNMDRGLDIAIKRALRNRGEEEIYIGGGLPSTVKYNSRFDKTLIMDDEKCYSILTRKIDELISARIQIHRDLLNLSLSGMKWDVRPYRTERETVNG